MFVERDRNGIEIYARTVFRTHVFTRTNCGTPSPLFIETKAAGHGTTAVSRESQFHGAADMTHVRHVHALRRAKAIFRSNMIIKSNGIRNSSGARILSSQSPFPPPLRRFLLRPTPPVPALSLLRSTHVFPGIRQGMHFTRFLSSLFFPALPSSSCPSALTPTFAGVGGNGETKRKHRGEKKRRKKEECIKDGRAFSRSSVYAAAHFGMWFVPHTK